MEKDNLQLLIERLEASIETHLTLLERLIFFKLEANDKVHREVAWEEEPLVEY